jgi:hypothetical protein
LSCSDLVRIALPTDRIAYGNRLTTYPDTRASVGKVEVTAVASPPLLTVLTGKQRCSPRSGNYASYQGRTDNSKSRPPPSSASGATGSSASPDPGPQPQPRPREKVSASPDPGPWPQPRPREKVSASPDPGPRPQPRPRRSRRLARPRPRISYATGDPSLPYP